MMCRQPPRYLGSSKAVRGFGYTQNDLHHTFKSCRFRAIISSDNCTGIYIQVALKIRADFNSFNLNVIFLRGFEWEMQ